MDSEQKMNAGVKVVCAVLLVAVVTAAGVGLLVQHRKLDEQRRARASLENANRQLVASRDELFSANGKLADELRAVRDAGRARAAEWAASEKDRAAWKETLSVLSNRVAEASAEAAEARAAQARAEKEVVGLKAAVKDLTASMKNARAEMNKICAERDLLKREMKKTRAERDSLERELNDAMRPVTESDSSVPTLAPMPFPASDAEDVLVPINPAPPPPDKRTPEERKAHEKEELNALIDL